jgi:hypothetical protein
VCFFEHRKVLRCFTRYFYGPCDYKGFGYNYKLEQFMGQGNDKIVNQAQDVLAQNFQPSLYLDLLN